MIKNIATIIMLFLASCDYSEVRNVTYEGYYDDDHKKLKLKGKLDDGKETGKWNYYDESGNLTQSGNYKNGYLIGYWDYHFEGFDTTINWKIINDGSFGKYSLSLPSTFHMIKTNDSTYFAMDTITRDGFLLTEYDLIPANDLGDYNLITQKNLRKEFEINSYKSFIIIATDTLYYFDEYDIKHKIESTELKFYTIYSIVGDKIAVFGYFCKPEYFYWGKFFLGEIYYHSFYLNDRIEPPFTNIKKIVQRN